jgi:site-specific recombinase XerD
MEMRNYTFSSRQLQLCAMVGFDYATQSIAQYQNIDIDSVRQKFLEKFLYYYCAFEKNETKYKVPATRGRGFYLVKRESKKYGFLYYVRYIDQGKTIPSMWCTHTNSMEEAEDFAYKNRDRIVRKYKARREENKNNTELFKIFETYYEKDSEYLLLDEKRNNPLGDKQRRLYFSHVNNVFLPFLIKNNIRFIKDIKPHTIINYQNEQLKKGNTPQTINGYISGLKRIFGYFADTGRIDVNPLSNVSNIKTSSKNRKIRGCHELTKLRGVFKTDWEDEISRLLLLMIYSTGLRNSEIARVRMKDIMTIEDVRFIKVEKSKTLAGKRIVPLHDLVYGEMKKYAEAKKLTDNDYIFSSLMNDNKTSAANIALGQKIGVTEAELDEQYITFYSGRHFYKTLMNAEKLGEDIEEIFIGHSVSSDVKKSYNHTDKRGKECMLAAARKSLDILDVNLF